MRTIAQITVGVVLLSGCDQRAAEENSTSLSQAMRGADGGLIANDAGDVADDGEPAAAVAAADPAPVGFRPEYGGRVLAVLEAARAPALNAFDWIKQAVGKRGVRFDKRLLWRASTGNRLPGPGFLQTPPMDQLWAVPPLRRVNYLDDGWLVQTPPRRQWGVLDFTLGSNPPPVGRRGPNINDDFRRYRCGPFKGCAPFPEVSNVEGAGFEFCRPILSTVTKPGDAPEQLCDLHSDTVPDYIYKVMTSAHDFIDVTGLGPGPTGNFRIAMNHALRFVAARTEAENATRPPGTDAHFVVARFVFGAAPIDVARIDQTALINDLMDGVSHKVVHAYVGAHRNHATMWNHSKIVAADGKVALVGGENYWDESYLVSPHGEYPVTDVTMVVEGGAAVSAHEYANRLWDTVCNHDAKSKLKRVHAAFTAGSLETGRIATRVNGWKSRSLGANAGIDKATAQLETLEATLEQYQAALRARDELEAAVRQLDPGDGGKPATKQRELLRSSARKAEKLKPGADEAEKALPAAEARLNELEASNHCVPMFDATLGYETAAATPLARTRDSEIDSVPIIGFGIDGTATVDANDAAIGAMIDSAKNHVYLIQQRLKPEGSDIVNEKWVGWAADRALLGGITTGNNLEWPVDLFRHLYGALLRDVHITIVVSGAPDIDGRPAAEYPGFVEEIPVALGRSFGTFENVNRQLLPSPDLVERMCRQVHIAGLHRGLSGRPSAQHSKLILIDHDLFYIGSQNMYRPKINEFGYIVDSAAAGEQIYRNLVQPLWAETARFAITGNGPKDCAFLKIFAPK